MSEQVLIVDAKDYHLDEENAMVIHPRKLGMAYTFNKECFDKAVIMNSPIHMLKSIGFFNIAKALKPGSTLEVFLDEPISVMQEVELEELEALAKRGGFVDIKTTGGEEKGKKGKESAKPKQFKMTMIKPTKE